MTSVLGLQPLKIKDIVIVAVLGEIVGAFGFAIVNNQPALEGIFTKILPQFVLLPLFVLGVPMAAVVALLFAYFLAKKIKPIFFQMGKFAAVGFSNTAIDWGIFNLILAPIGFSSAGQVIYALGKGISFAFATLNSFVWNKFWSFEKKETKGVGKEAATFYAFTAVGLVINVTVALIVRNIGPHSDLWGGVVSPALATAVSMIWDFFAYKFFVFKSGQPAVEPEK